MTVPSTLRGEGERELVQRYAEARTTLRNSPAPPPRPLRPRPVSPFDPARIAAAELEWKRAERKRRGIFTGPIIEVDDNGLDENGETPWQITATIPTWRAITLETSQKHGVSVLDLLSARREHSIVVARDEAFYRCRHETTMSLPQIGRRYGKDHTSVLAGVRRHEKRMAEASSE